MTHSFPTRRSSDLVGKLVDTSSRSRYVARLAEGSRNVAMPSKLEAYAQQHLTPQSRKPIDQAIAKIRESIETRGRIKSGVTAWLVTAVKRSEEHTSELQSLMHISYAVFCLTKTT